jgi:hypothetical protein
MLMIFLVGALQVQTHAQSQEKMYSLLLMHFARGINWPAHLPNRPFVIGVLEYQPLAAELQTLSSTTKINGRRLQVKTIASAAESSGCNIVFIPAYKAKAIPEFVEHTSKEAVLIVSNKNEVARKNGGINFLLLAGKLTYEINCNAIEKRGMKVSASAKNLGIIVNN